MIDIQSYQLAELISLRACPHLSEEAASLYFWEGFCMIIYRHSLTKSERYWVCINDA